MITMDTMLEDSNIIVLPGQEGFYQALLNRVTNEKFSELCEFIQSNWKQIASSAVIPLGNLEQNKVTYNDIFWRNMTQIWTLLKVQDKTVQQASFAIEIEKVTRNPKNRAKRLRWNLISAISLKSAGDPDKVKSKVYKASFLLAKSINTANSDETTWRDVASDAILMVEQLYHWDETDLDKHFISSVLENLETSPNVRGAFSMIWRIGLTLLNFGEPLAINCFNLCAILSRKSQDYELLVSALTNLGAAINDISGDKQKGLEISLEAIAIADAHGLKNDTHAIFDAGNILLNLRRASEAEPYLRRALALGKHRNEYSEVVYALRALARQFNWRGLVPDARELFEEAVAIGIRENELEAAHTALVELADLLRDTGEYENARKAYLDARRLAEKVGNVVAARDYNLNIETMGSAIKGEIVIFQTIEDGKWKGHGLPRVPFFDEQVKEMDSLIPYWDAFQMIKFQTDFEEEISTLRESIVHAINNQDTLQETENRIALTRRIYENIIFQRQPDDITEASNTIRENNKFLPPIDSIQDEIIEAGVLFALAVEQNFSDLFANRVEESQRIYFTPTEEIPPEPNSLSAVGGQAERQYSENTDLIWRALVLLHKTPPDRIVSDLIRLIVLLPKYKALNLLQSSLSDPNMREWSVLLAGTLDPMCTPEEILPILRSLLADTALEASARASILALLGERESQLGLIQEGQDHLKQALLISNKINDIGSQAHILGAVGRIYRQSGKYDKALECYDSAISIAKSSDQKGYLASALHSKGNLLFDLMDFPAARACFYSALDEYLITDGFSHMAFIFDNLANIARSEGNQDKEIWFRRRALDLAHWSHEVEAVALCSYHLGSSYLQISEFEKSIKLLRQASVLYSQQGRLDRVTFVENAIGRWYAEKTNPQYSKQQARASYDKAFDLAERLMVLSQQVASLSGLAGLVASDDIDLASVYLDKAIDLCWKIPDYNDLVGLSRRKALILEYKGQKKSALDVLTSTLSMLDIVRTKYSNRTDYLDFVAVEYAQVCEQAAYNAFLLQDHGLTFQLAERAKGLSLREQLTRHWAQRTAPKSIRPEWLKREKELLETLDDIAISGQYATASHATQIDVKYQDVMTELRSLWQEISKVAPDYVMRQQIFALDVVDVQKQLSKIEGAPYLVEFLFSRERDYGIMMLLHPQRGCAAIALPNVINIHTLARARQLIEKELSEYPMRGYLGETWAEALAPLGRAVDMFVPEGAPIIFVPHGQLHHVPLHALSVGSKRLIERNPIAYIPTADILRLAHSTTSTNSALVIGAVFEEEAREIGSLLGAEMLIGEKATETAVWHALPNYNVIHFSCHGLFDPKYPFLSGLQLAQNDVLTANTILQSRLNAALVVLSACQTGRSRVQAGDELQGLTQSFLIAGAQTVISTLWSVDARATAQFMVKYYKGLLKDGVTPTEALRQAQIYMIQSDEWSHPYYWAAFVANSVT